MLDRYAGAPGVSAAEGFALVKLHRVRLSGHADENALTSSRGNRVVHRLGLTQRTVPSRAREIARRPPDRDVFRHMAAYVPTNTTPPNHHRSAT